MKLFKLTDIYPDPKKAKTKCIVFAKKMKAGRNLANIKLNGVDLPWVTQVKHLGHTLQSDNTMKVDMAIKRGAFIGKAKFLTAGVSYSSL